ncbi:MAG TPA: ribokinase [Armatimonadota bacterium]|jgi:ribokinase
MTKPQLLIIGSTNTDMVVQGATLPQPGETVTGGAFRLSPGGKGANQAVAAARAGAAVTFITALGDDALGQDSRERFTRDGIAIDYLVGKPGMATGVALIMVDASGENMISVAPGANDALTPENLVAAAPAFLDVQMLIMQLEIPLPSVQWAADYATKLGCPLLLNPAPMPPGGLPDSLLRCVQVLTPNEGELRALAPDAPTLEAAAASVLSRGPQVVVVTRGRQGAEVFTAQETFHVPAFPVAAVDTVGAGDCFTAALGVALVEAQPLRDAVRFAAAAAALSTTLRGAQEAMPSREAIERFLEAMAVAD